MKSNIIRLPSEPEFDDLGDYPWLGEIETPLRDDAFEIEDQEKIDRIRFHFAEIMTVLGLDLNDESLRDTPNRVAKMYVKEVFSGLDPDNFPSISLFKNNYKYNQMLLERNITFYSYCEHHFVPIIGKAHVAYVPEKYVIGLSKLNRIVQYFSRRPQVQERLTEQIAESLKKHLQTESVAVVIEADHLCVSSRGVEDVHSDTVTSHYSGKFRNENVRNELLQMIKKC